MEQHELLRKCRTLNNLLIGRSDHNYTEIDGRSKKACNELLARVGCQETEGLEAAYSKAIAEIAKLIKRGVLKGVTEEALTELENDYAAIPTCASDDSDEKSRADVEEKEGAVEEVAADHDEATGAAPVTERRLYYGYPAHPAAEAFPLMPECELKELAESIQSNGLLNPIVLYDGEVVDGRCRSLGCKMAGCEPIYREWDGAGQSLVSWIAAQNLPRRHMTPSQRALVAARLRAEFEKESTARQLSNLRQNRASTESLDPGSRCNTGKSATRAAKATGVSTDAVEKATRVLSSGTPELQAAVSAGTVSLDAASVVAELPEREQEQVIKAGTAAEAAKAVRKRKKAKAAGKKTKLEPRGEELEVAEPPASEPSPGPGGWPETIPPPDEWPLERRAEEWFGYVTKRTYCHRVYRKVAERTLQKIIELCESCREEIKRVEEKHAHDPDPSDREEE